MAPNITTVSRSVPVSSPPGFSDYMAQFLANQYAARKGKEEKASNYEQDLFKTMASGMASTKQLRPPKSGEKGFVVGGQEIPWTWNEGQVDVDDAYKQMQTRKLGTELGLPGYEPTDVYLQNQAQDEADKQLNRSMRFQMLVGSPKTEDQAVIEGLRKTRAQQIYAQMKAGYNKAITTETPPDYEGALPTDEVFKDADGKWKVRRGKDVYRIE